MSLTGFGRRRETFSYRLLPTTGLLEKFATNAPVKGAGCVTGKTDDPAS